MKDESRAAFARVTTENVGRKAEVRIDGKTVMSPVIREPIQGGSLQVSGGLTVAEVADLVARLKSGGARILNEPRRGAGGHEYVFVHPGSTGGVLLELIQDAEAGI